jgi:hypothetical protein
MPEDKDQFLADNLSPVPNEPSGAPEADRSLIIACPTADESPRHEREKIDPAGTSVGRDELAETGRAPGAERSGSAGATRVAAGVGAILTVGSTAFAIAGGFIQVQDEPAKIWNMGAALLASILACGVFLLWRRRTRPELQTWRRQVLVGAGAVAISLLVFFVFSLARPSQSPTQGGGGSPGPTMSIAQSPTDDPDATKDIHEHEIWPSSQENISVPLTKKGDWVMTDFRVSLPYLRSVEVAAGAEGSRILLSVYDAHMQEIKAGEKVISGYRGKVIFDPVVDVSSYVGERLYLKVTKIYDDPIHVYFSRNDADPGITSYRRCGGKPLECPNDAAHDLSVLIIGRKSAR